MDKTRMIQPSQSLNLITDFTGIYVLKNEHIEALLKYLNDPSFWDLIAQIFKQNPSELISSVRVYPFDIINTMRMTLARYQQLSLGGQKLEIDGNPMIVPTIEDKEIVKMRIGMGKITIPKIHGTYRDYYNKYTLYLPYLESVELDSEECTPNENDDSVILDIYYVIDLFTGELTASIMKEYKNEDNEQDERVISIVNGNIGIDIPISTSNKSEIALKVIRDSVKAITTKGASLLSLDIPVVNYAQVGNYSDGLGKMFGCQKPYLKIESDIVSTNELYTKLNGKPLNRTRYLRALNGYTEFEDIRLEDVQDITSEERSELYNLLTTGVYF